MSTDQRDRWLNRSNEPAFNKGIQLRQPPDSTPFNTFLAVLRRSHPLIPTAFDGPLDTLTHRVTALWDSSVSCDSVMYEEKRSLAIATADYISRHPFFSMPETDPHLRQVAGLEFFERPAQPFPFEVPISASKRNLRPEIIEALWILSVLLRSAGVSWTPPSAPEGNVAYIPYYSCKTNAERTALPKRSRATDLARVALFFRQAACNPVEKQALSLYSFTRTTIAPPTASNVRPLTKQYYQQGAGVEGTFEAREKTPLESGIMYFVAKLMEIRDAKSAVRGAASLNPLYFDHFTLQREGNAAYFMNSNLQAIPGTRTTAASNISLLLLFLKNALKDKERPNTGTLLNVRRASIKNNVTILIVPLVKFWTYGCTPVCVNGAIDNGVLQFEAAFMEAVVEMVFEDKKETSAVWARLARRLDDAIQTLLQTTQPPLPPPDNAPLSPPMSAVAPPSSMVKPISPLIDDDDEQLALYDPMMDTSLKQALLSLPHVGQSNQADGQSGSAGSSAQPAPAAMPSHPALYPAASNWGLPESQQFPPLPPLNTAPAASPSHTTAPSPRFQSPLPKPPSLSAFSDAPPAPQTSRESTPLSTPRASPPRQPRQSSQPSPSLHNELTRSPPKDSFKAMRGGKVVNHKRRKATTAKTSALAADSTIQEYSDGPEREEPGRSLPDPSLQKSTQQGMDVITAASQQGFFAEPRGSSHSHSHGAKRPRISSPVSEEPPPPPLLKLFPTHPPLAHSPPGGKIKDAAELLEPNWEKGDGSSDGGDAMDVDSASSQSLPQKAMVIKAPTPWLNHSTGLVELRLESFEYRYQAQVS